MKRKGSSKPNNELQTSPPGSPPPQRMTPSSPSIQKVTTKSGKLKERYVFHETNRASLLSTEAPAQNYRGIINLIMLVLFVTHIRMIMENMLKYGILINLTSTYIEWWSAIPTLCSYNIFILIAYNLERAVNEKKITEKRCMLFHVINCVAVLAAPIALIEITDALPATGLLVLTNAIVLWMKLISYAYSNKEYREAMEKGQPYYEFIQEDSKPLAYPNNLTLKNMYYYIYAPTLIYQLNYPRSPRIRPIWLAKRCLELVFYMALALFLMEQYLFPTLRNAVVPLQKLDFIRILERVMKLSIPNVYIWLIGFYALFHLWLNICAEVLRFGDRNFYGPWWNCTTMDEYWRIWNIPTHNWLMKHIHVPLVRAGFPRVFSGICVFIVSAIFHELLVSVPVHTFRFWAFMGFMGNIPLIILTRKLFQGSQIGNVIFWLSFCFLGQPLAIVLYYGDYATRYPPIPAIIT